MVPQVAVDDGLSSDPFSFYQDIRPQPEADLDGSEIVDALVIAAVFVVGYEGLDLRFEITGEAVIFQQDAAIKDLIAAARYCRGLS